MVKKRRDLTKEEIAQYDKLTAQAEQIQLDLDALLNKPTAYGYARVSTQKQAKDGNSLEGQENALIEAGATKVYHDTYTGTVTDRPQLDKLLNILTPGDTIIVTKLDRIARSVQQGIELINNLCEKGIKVHVLNIGMLDDTATGRLIRNIMLSFAEFERDMILQRTREGKQIAKEKSGYHEGRNFKYTKVQVSHALELLSTHSYTQVSQLTGISKSTLQRFKAEQNSNSNKRK